MEHVELHGPSSTKTTASAFYYSTVETAEGYCGVTSYRSGRLVLSSVSTPLWEPRRGVISTQPR